LTILENKEYLETVQAGYFNIIMVRTGDQGKTTLEKIYTR
jgi:predicted transcriptional regulator of viral defense system